jgi:hypothetical protein
VGVARVGRVMMAGLPQPSASLTTRSNGRPAVRLDKAEAARGVEGQCGIGSAWRGL